VGRWKENCGCNSGAREGWNQHWRTPLRHSLDWLRDELAPLFEGKAGELLRDPWQARNQYISVMLDRSQTTREKFFVEQAAHRLNDDEKVAVLKLMELQRHAMLMYTSCGWFFDDISGIESVQVAQYAARAIQLAQEIFGRDFEPGFLEKFEGAKSNIAEHCDGRCIYQKFVKPAMIDWPKAAAHYAISSIFHQYDGKTRIFSFSYVDEHRELLTAGKTRLAIGRIKIVSEITEESKVMTYAIVYMGEHNLTGGVRDFQSLEAYDAMVQELRAVYERADFPEVIRLIDRHFGQASYSLRSLFKDEQRRILDEILASTREDLEGRFRLVAERYEPLMRFLESAGVPLPSGLEAVIDFVLHSDLQREIDSEPLNLDHLRSLIARAQTRASTVLDARISFVVKNRMEQFIEAVALDPSQVERMRILEQFAALVMPLPLGLNLWKVQNTYWELLQKTLPEFKARAPGSEADQAWVEQFLSLGERLGFAVQHLREAAPEFRCAA
jgi:hypothetical protein